MDGSRAEQYARLVRERKACRLCADLSNPAAVDDGRFDADAIGPWSRCHGDLDARLMVVGQDWGDVEYFRRNHGLDDAGNPTAAALRELISTLGVRIGPPVEESVTSGVFLTNAILCLKSDGLQAAVQPGWLANCRSFLRRQIDIVRPPVAVGLGAHAYAALLGAFELPVGPFRSEVERPDGVLLPNGTRAFAVYHCGRRVQNTHRSLAQQRQDWKRMAKYLAP